MVKSMDEFIHEIGIQSHIDEMVEIIKKYAMEDKRELKNYKHSIKSRSHKKIRGLME